MNLNAVLNLIESYGADLLLSAIPVCLVTALLKWKCPSKLKKLFTFVPFVLGIILFIGVAAIKQKGFAGLDYQALITLGLRSGSIATIYYVVYEQFLRKKKQTQTSLSPVQLAITGILSDRVSGKNLETILSAVPELASIQDDGSLYLKLTELLQNDIPDENDRNAVSALVLKVIRIL